MLLIVYFSRVQDQAGILRKSLSGELSDSFELIQISDPDQVHSFLEYQMPSIAIFDLNDSDFQRPEIYESIRTDPWLENIGIFAVYDGKLLDLESLYPFFYVFKRNEPESLYTKVFSVFLKNENLLFRNGILRDLDHKGYFEIENDLSLSQPYSDLIANTICNRGLIPIQKKYGLILALNELIINAIEHGNCEIGNQEKKEWLYTGKLIQELISKRVSNPEIARRRVRLEYEFLEEEAVVTITDEGQGFDYQTYLQNSDSFFSSDFSGRGIILAKNITKTLEYSGKGNIVSIRIQYDEDRKWRIPRGFSESSIKKFQKSEIIFREGDPSDGIYYVVSGEFEILRNDKVVDIIDRSSIFIGEMAFLLGHKRTATVIARTDAQLIFISLDKWIDTIREFPLYGIYLAKILARKLNNLSRVFSEHL